MRNNDVLGLSRIFEVCTAAATGTRPVPSNGLGIRITDAVTAPLSTCGCGWSLGVGSYEYQHVYPGNDHRLGRLRIAPPAVGPWVWAAGLAVTPHLGASTHRTPLLRTLLMLYGHVCQKAFNFGQERRDLSRDYPSRCPPASLKYILGDLQPFTKDDKVNLTPSPQYPYSTGERGGIFLPGVKRLHKHTHTHGDARAPQSYLICSDLLLSSFVVLFTPPTQPFSQSPSLEERRQNY